MVPPILLIAEREFRTYVATISFWFTLALAPLAGGAALIFAPSDTLPMVKVIGGDAVSIRDAMSALRQAGRLEGKSYRFAPQGSVLRLIQNSPAHLDLDFAPAFPLSTSGRALVGAVLERNAAIEALAGTPLVVRSRVEPGGNVMNAGLEARLIAMTALWLTLTGSLGMLLQAIVRERANRGLESLMASARGWEIVTGKVIGIGAVSSLVLITWGGTAILLSSLARPGPIAEIFSNLSDPATLARDGLIFICAFAFYGALTVMMGAVARDSASAQNLARPLFMLLLVGFLTALASVRGASPALSWLEWLPPFTPFLLLMRNPAYDISFSSLPPPLILLCLMSCIGLAVAGRSLSITPPTYQIFRRRSKAPPLVG